MFEREKGRIGGHVTASRHDLAARGKRGREAAESRLLALLVREVDPEAVLSEEERARRVVQARKAHFARLQLASAKSQRLGTKIARQIEADRELSRLRRALMDGTP
jgi:hypothetical protein